MSKEAKRIGRATYYKLWKDDNHAITIDGKIITIKEQLNYIHDNPVRNGLVDEQWDYVYSSARDYQGKKGLVLIKIWKDSPRCKRGIVEGILYTVAGKKGFNSCFCTF